MIRSVFGGQKKASVGKIGCALLFRDKKSIVNCEIKRRKEKKENKKKKEVAFLFSSFMTRFFSKKASYLRSTNSRLN